MADITVELNLVPVPGQSGAARYQQSVIEDSNDLVDHEVPVFDSAGTADIDFSFSFEVPDGWDGTTDPSISITSHFNATTGKYRLQVLYESSAKTVTGDPASFDETINITSATGDTVPGTARIMDEASATLDDTKFAKKAIVRGLLRRVLSDTTNDTVTADQQIDGAVIHFTAA